MYLKSSGQNDSEESDSKSYSVHNSQVTSKGLSPSKNSQVKPTLNLNVGAATKEKAQKYLQQDAMKSPTPSMTPTVNTEQDPPTEKQ